MQDCFINRKAKLRYKRSLSTRGNCATAAYPERLQDSEPPGACPCPFPPTTPEAELQILGANHASGRHAQQTAGSPGRGTRARPRSARRDLTSFWSFYQKWETGAVSAKAAGIAAALKARAGRAARPAAAVAVLSPGRLTHRAILEIHRFGQEINPDGCLKRRKASAAATRLPASAHQIFPYDL